MSLEELAAREEIREVVARYCRGADRMDWDLVRTCFHSDARDEHGLYSGDVDGMIDFFRDWSGSNYLLAMHLIGNQIIDIEGDRAICETYCKSHMRLDAAQAASKSFSALFDSDHLEDVLAACHCGLVDLTIAIRFVDLFERRAAEAPWLIAHRTVVHEWDRLDPVRARIGTVGTHSARRDQNDIIFVRLHELHTIGAP